jgi:hypothetical protein
MRGPSWTPTFDLLVPGAVDDLRWASPLSSRRPAGTAVAPRSGPASPAGRASLSADACQELAAGRNQLDQARLLIEARLTSPDPSLDPAQLQRALDMALALAGRLGFAGLKVEGWPAPPALEPAALAWPDPPPRRLGVARRMLHWRVQTGPGDVVEVALDGSESDVLVLVLDLSNFESYRHGGTCRYYGGHYTRSPAVIRPPHSGFWHVVVAPSGGRVRAGVRVRRG